MATASAVWDLISREPKAPIGVLTDAFILKFAKFLNWQHLSAHYTFTFDMLRIFQHRVHWSMILERCRFPEFFLREMAPNFDNHCWAVVSRHQVLSEQFIHDFSGCLDWDYVTLYQNVSGEFLRTHYEFYTDEEQRLQVVPNSN